jgi:toxin ParE1/3/4
VRWSARGRADLKAIHDHIAKHSSFNARAISLEIVARAARLAETPRLGRVVPELGDPHIREIPLHSWRLVYELRGENLFILTLVHKRRSPAVEQLRR